MRPEVPWNKVSPAEMLRRHVRVTLQPFDAPPRPEQTRRIIDEIGAEEMFLFSTDYPHWHFDGTSVIPEGLPESLVHRMLFDNPLETYPRLARRACPKGSLKVA